MLVDIDGRYIAAVTGRMGFRVHNDMFTTRQYKKSILIETLYDLFRRLADGPIRVRWYGGAYGFYNIGT